MPQPKSTSASVSDSAPVIELLGQVKTGSLSVQAASAILARRTQTATPSNYTRNASAIPHAALPWPIIGNATDPTTKATLLHVDCLTRDNAQLVLAIQQQLGFGNSANQQSNAPQVLVFSFTDCENFPSLVDRLGWPPPKPVANSWLAQLDQWKETLLAKGWPLEYGNADDLMIDSRAQITWPWLPIRIAQSLLSGNLQQNSNASQTPTASLAAWTPLPSHNNPLPAIQRISQLLAFQPDAAEIAKPSVALADKFPANHGAHQGLSQTDPRKQTAKSRRDRRKTLEKGMLATGAVVVLGLGLWQLFPGHHPGNSGETTQASATPSASQPGSAGLFSSQPGTSQLDRSAEAARTEPQQLQTLSKIPQAPGSPPPDSDPASPNFAEDLGIDRFDASSFTGPTINLQSAGFAPATADIGPSSTQAEFDTASEFPTPSSGIQDATDPSPSETSDEENSDEENSDAENSGKESSRKEINDSPQAITAATTAAKVVQLPDRGDTAPLELPLDAQLGPQQLSLQLPAVASWNLLPSSNSNRLAIASRENESLDSAVAFITWPDSSEAAPPTFQWTELAADDPAVESLRNARLLGGGTPIYLRTPERVEPLAVDFATRPHRWSLKTAPDTKQTTATLSLFDRHDNERQRNVEKNDKPANHIPLIFQWLLPVDAQSGRKTRGLVEIRETEEAAVRIRLRADLQIGRAVELETVAIASLDPAGGWTALTEQTLPTTLDRLATVKQNLSTALNQVRQQYSAASNKDLKSLLRQKRDYLEQQEGSTKLYGERLSELQTLVGRIQNELSWQLTIATAWPDDQQIILESETP